jgi:hypothetical protein
VAERGLPALLLLASLHHRNTRIIASFCLTQSSCL